MRRWELPIPDGPISAGAGLAPPAHVESACVIFYVDEKRVATFDVIDSLQEPLNFTLGVNGSPFAGVRMYVSPRSSKLSVKKFQPSYLGPVHSDLAVLWHDRKWQLDVQDVPQSAADAVDEATVRRTLRASVAVAAA